jgi:DNA-binding NarL/FixJ family response regulator
MAAVKSRPAASPSQQETLERPNAGLESAAGDGALRILIVDEHELFGDACQAIVDRGIEVVGIARNQQEIFSAVSVRAPDVVLRCVWARGLPEGSPRSRVALSAIPSANGNGHAREELENPAASVLQQAGFREPGSSQEPHPVLTVLTPRERQVLTLLLEGATNKEMAKRLSIRSNTVRTHVQNILFKLGVHTRLGAATLAMRHGLSKPDGFE